MSRVLMPKTTSSSSSTELCNKTAQQKSKGTFSNFNTDATPTYKGDSNQSSISGSHCSLLDFEDITSNSSILEFLKQEQNCYENGASSNVNNDHDSEADADSIFQEISRLADNSDTRSVDELLREAELLLKHQNVLEKKHSSHTSFIQSSFTLESSAVKVKSKSFQTPKTEKMVLSNGNKNTSYSSSATTVVATPDSDTLTSTVANEECKFNHFADNVPTESLISQESAPQVFNCNNTVISANNTSKDIDTQQQLNGEEPDEGTDTIEELTEAMETIELEIIQNEEDSLIEPPDNCFVNNSLPENELNKNATTSFSSMISYTTVCTAAVMQPQLQQPSLPGMTTQCNQSLYEYTLGRRSSDEVVTTSAFATPPQMQGSATSLSASPLRRLQPGDRRNSVYLGPRSSMTTPDSGISSQTHVTTTSSRSSSPIVKSVGVSTLLHTCCDKSSNSSPRHFVSTLTSPIDTQSSLTSVTREHALKQEIEQLQERLKDTEERLESFRIQHDTLSQLHRKLRESNTQLQDESEMLKLDVQHLNECANVLRAELQSARNDRDEALELQNILKTELEETRNEKKRAQEQKEKDAKTIQDLQRQCREMERILMRKHPDSVSALIVASKATNIRANNDQENLSSRKLLEQRIAQLEADAKEQDTKAQQILANVQARFNSVQAKYETHIADLETQVLSLQEINTKLNEKIESQVRTLDYFVSKKAERFYNNCTQTEESYTCTLALPSNPLPQLQPALKSGPFTKPAKKVALKTISTQTLASTRECSTNTIGTSSQHSANSSTSSTANSTPNNSRPNSKQSGLRKPVTTSGTSKLPVSQSDANISSNALQAAIHAKEDAHLLATIRGMRIDLAIKSKALQRLTRELDDCKRTIKKLQKEKDGSKCDKPYSTASTSVNILRQQQGALVPATTEGQALKEAQNRYKLLQADYRTLHEKRLQDLKTLQTAHERELASCHETVRILQQRLNERDEHIALQKRRKLPVDYYALKAKVTSLERRHTEREERLHMLVEALSKGRLNSALDDLIGENNNQRNGKEEKYVKPKTLY
ncbi:uncharacterized protein ACN2A1_011869 isoform 2-T2 [Glossina fuscipes fuscipes]